MSKMDALRAMREARYEQAAARARTGPAAAAQKPAAATKTSAKASAKAPATPAATDPDEAGLCGHRSMNGRTCTREAGHAAKTHRYG
jgi:hypothetical protein